MIKSIVARLDSIKPPRWMLKIEKRFRFVLSTLILSGIMLFSTFFFFDAAWIFIPLLVISVILLTYFSILEDIDKNEWLMLFMMPILFTVALYIFYYLFPVRWLTRIPFISIYAISIYAILLTSNIFNVGVEKNLQLYRAAFSVNYFYQTLIVFLFFNILLSLKENFWVNMLGAGIITFPLALQFFWSRKLDHFFERDVVMFSVLLTIIMAQIALIFSFVPFTTTIFSLLLTAAYYGLAGICFSFLDLRLFKETVREYFIVLGFVLLIAILTLNW